VSRKIGPESYNILAFGLGAISKPLLLKLTDLFFNRFEDFTAAHQLFYGVNID
jgi:hypothetical protein